jgi:diketogulonate reductase-like aldo/keto reductase
MTLTLQSTMRLNNGVTVPVLGLGTLHGHGKNLIEAMLFAFDLGYRHFDTAKAYENEHDVGLAIRKSGIPRDEIFVTTKLWNTDHGYDHALAAVEASLRRLGVDYADLYLVHWPVSGQRPETWRAMETLYRAGKARAIGVSNYTERHLTELLASADIVPAVNQIEYSPFLYQRSLQAFCEARGIRIEAWSPLTRGLKLNEPRLNTIASQYAKTPAQILLRWGLQHDVIEIPKALMPAHLQENAALFDFTIAPRDMAALDALDEGLRTGGWDPYSARFR